MSTGATFESFEKELNRLVGTFERGLAEFKSPGYVEAQLRDDFLNPFFRALGWDLENRAGLIQTEREVEIESRTQIQGRPSCARRSRNPNAQRSKTPSPPPTGKSINWSMNSTTSRRKKSNLSRGQSKSPVVRRSPDRAHSSTAGLPEPTGDRSVTVGGAVREPKRSGDAADVCGKPAHSTLRAAFRAWRGSLPTALERDTLLWPEAIAESVVAEASRYLQAELPADYPARLAAKAYHLYPRHRFFHKVLNRPGNHGRHNLYVYMRHWTCSWLKRERYPLFKRLPWEYALGRRLPSTPSTSQ